MDQPTLSALSTTYGGVAIRLRAFELAAQVTVYGSASAASLVRDAKIIEAYLNGADQDKADPAKLSDG